MKKQTKWWKLEPFIFLFFVLLSLVPVISSRFFPTIDGPAHLHNANLLKHLWFGEGNWLLQFFEQNQQLNSNWINHLWYVMASFVLPSWLAEKSLLLFYVIAFPISFRYLVKIITKEERSAAISSYLVFPFIYSFPFCIGFYNFCLGLPLILWSTGFWLQTKDSTQGRNTILLASLITLTYLSHVFNFLVLQIILGFLLLDEMLREKQWRSSLKKTLHVVIVSFPGLILLFSFLYTNSRFAHEPPRYLPGEKMVRMITGMEPLITLNLEREAPYVNIILYALCVLAGMALYRMVKKAGSRRNWVWLLLSVTVLLIYFLFPDWVSSGGFISVRWALFFFLLITLWIAGMALPPRLLMWPVVAILVAHTLLIHYHRGETIALSREAAEAATVEEHLEEQTVLLPLNYSKNWIHINYGCYQVTEKEIVVLDNYEATKPHFPLIWKKGESVYELMKHYGDRNPPCIDIENYESSTHHRIDYVSRWLFDGDLSDSCANAANDEIHRKFDLVFESSTKRLQLFKRKQE